MSSGFQPTEEGGYEALRGHVRDRALLALRRHGPILDEASMCRVLEDPDIVRFPTRLVFDAADLLEGEFGWARPRGERPAEGFDLVMHPHFAGRWDVLPLLVAYHIVSINYLDIATHVEAEIFGSTLMRIEGEEYYAAVCRLADSIPGAAAHDPGLSERFQVASTNGSCGSGSGGGPCGCHDGEGL